MHPMWPLCLCTTSQRASTAPSCVRTPLQSVTTERDNALSLSAQGPTQAARFCSPAREPASALEWQVPLGPADWGCTCTASPQAHRRAGWPVGGTVPTHTHLSPSPQRNGVWAKGVQPGVSSTGNSCWVA